MSRRGWWVAGFLAATGLAVGMELWAAVDGDPDTVTWTELVVSYVPWEVAAAAVGALLLWLPLHWGVRYWRRHRDVDDG